MAWVRGRESKGKVTAAEHTTAKAMETANNREKERGTVTEYKMVAMKA